MRYYLKFKTANAIFRFQVICVHNKAVCTNIKHRCPGPSPKKAVFVGSNAVQSVVITGGIMGCGRVSCHACHKKIGKSYSHSCVAVGEPRTEYRSACGGYFCVRSVLGNG